MPLQGAVRFVDGIRKGVVRHGLMFGIALGLVPATASAQSPRPAVAALFHSEWVVIGGSGRSIATDRRAGREQAFYAIEWGRVVTGEHGPGVLRGRLEMAVEVTPLFLAFQSDRAEGAGLSPLMFRWNLREGGRLSPFLEIASGIVATNHDLPEGTTRMNFASHAGVGARIRVAGRWGAVAGYRFQHLSNGNTASRNPGINSNIGYLGVAYRR
jgi:hypothetical protein